MVYVLYLYLSAFRYRDLACAAAMAWVLFLITGLLAVFIFWSSKKWVNYDTI